MILITGGLGFIGPHTGRALLDLGESVVVTRYRTSRVPDFLEAELGRRLFVERADITDLDDLRRIGRTHRIDGVLHLATPRLAGRGLTRIRDAVGYRPEYDVLRGVADYIAWLRAGHEQ